MSLFDKSELGSILSLESELIENGEKPKKAKKIVRREFNKWLIDFGKNLKNEISKNSTLDPQFKDTRVARARKDFHFFRVTYFPHYYRLKGVSELQAHLEEVYHKIVDTKHSNKFAIAAPRGFGKSTDVNIAFVIWLLAYNLKHFITIFSDAIELTETLIEAIKVELEENDNLKADFPHIAGEGSVWKVGEIVTKNNIKIKGYGSGKRVRGVKHGIYRPDIAIIDDLENDINVRSRTQRDKLEEWLDEAVANLGGVDDTMDIIYIGTILHRDSVLSRKLKLKYWNPITFRALVSYPNRMDLWDEYGEIYRDSGVEEANKFYISNEKLMDAGAKTIWEAVSLESLMRQRAENIRAFEKEKQNNPNSENATFNSAKFKIVTHTQLPKFDKKFLYVDLAKKSEKTNKNDYTSFIKAGVNYAEKKLYVYFSKRKRVDGKAVVNEVLKMQKEEQFNLIGGDENGGFFLLREWLRSEAFDRNISINTKFLHHKKKKEDRLAELEFPIEAEEIVFVGEHRELFGEMDDFPESDYDDLHDGLSGVYILSKLKKPNSKPLKPRVFKKRWR